MEKFDWSIFSNAGSFFVAFLTLVFTFYFVWKRNQSLRDEQQKAIAGLIKVLRENPIEFLFGEVSKNSSSGTSNFWTLLYIGNQKPDSLKSEFDDIELYFHYKSNQIIGIKDFIENSYIPPKIRKVLQNFSPKSYDNVNSNTIKDYTPFVSLSTNYFVEQHPFELERNQKTNQLKFPEGAIAFESWLSFKISCTNLVKEINRHLDKINASDLKV